VTINSTVGISSLFHGTPTLVLGKAFYDIKGLTCKGMPLDRFWTEYSPPDHLLFRKFRNYIIDKTQIQGSFYKFGNTLSCLSGNEKRSAGRSVGEKQPVVLLKLKKRCQLKPQINRTVWRHHYCIDSEGRNQKVMRQRIENVPQVKTVKQLAAENLKI
jgi:hypothetical protein